MRLRIREKKVLCISTYLSRYWTYQIPTEASRNKYSLGLCHTTRPSTFHIPSRNVVQDMARCNVRFFFREDHGLIIIIIFFFFFFLNPADHHPHRPLMSRSRRPHSHRHGSQLRRLGLWGKQIRSRIQHEYVSDSTAGY